MENIITVLSICGKIDTNSLEKLKSALENSLQNSEYIIIEINEVRSINYSGLKTLVKYASTYKNFALVGVSSTIKTMLNVMAIHSFNVFQNKEEAINFFRKISNTEIKIKQKILELYMNIPLCIAINMIEVDDAICGICDGDLGHVSVGPSICRMDDFSLVCEKCSKQSPKLVSVLDCAFKRKKRHTKKIEKQLLHRVVEKISQQKYQHSLPGEVFELEVDKSETA